MKMHKTLFLNWLGALVLALLMPASASTQQPNTPAYARARATLPPDQAAAFDEILTRARARGLPTSPLIDKALEGAAKGAAPDRVIEVVRQRADQLGRARDIIGARSSNEVVTVALALDRGVDQGVARRVAAGARREEPVGMALNTLADLLARGVPVDNALDVLTSWRARGAKAGELPELPAAVERLVREGARPDQAAIVLADAMRSGHGVSTVRLGNLGQSKATGPKVDRPRVAPRTTGKAAGGRAAGAKPNVPTPPKPKGN